VTVDTGSLSLDEFMRLVGSIGLKSEPEMEQEFEDALRFFDKDGRVLVSAQSRGLVVSGSVRDGLLVSRPASDVDSASLLQPVVYCSSLSEPLMWTARL